MDVNLCVKCVPELREFDEPNTIKSVMRLVCRIWAESGECHLAAVYCIMYWRTIWWKGKCDNLISIYTEKSKCFIKKKKRFSATDYKHFLASYAFY